MRTRQRPILLSGPMGAGKTTLGALLARETPHAFVDVDARIEEETGKSIRALFVELGEVAFRDLEERIAFDCLQNTQYDVIALGGGTVLRRTFRHAALREGFLVTLTAPPRTLAERVCGSDRPLLASTATVADTEERLRRILDERADVYAECHATVDTHDTRLPVLAEQIRTQAASASLVMPLGRRSYGITPIESAPEQIGAMVSQRRPSGVLLVTDENVSTRQRAYVDRLRTSIEVPVETAILAPGEAHKDLAQVVRLWDAALGANLDRSAIVLSVGGGVVSDMAGFAAATLLRGIRWISVPSTLLAMVDASVGGKTGFDHAHGKNRIGAIHQPRAVIIDLSLLDTLAERELRAGTAEMLKMALLSGPDALADFRGSVSAILRRDRETLRTSIERAVAAKIRVVAEDEHEEGVRIALNLGHTMGHAIEAAGGYTRHLHGEAVGLGLLLEHGFGVRKGWTDPSLVAELHASLTQLGLPTTVGAPLREEAAKHLGLDKKRRGGVIKLPLLESPGKVVVHEVELAEAAREMQIP